MICPQCGAEYPWHAMVCPRCDVETVDRLPGPAPTPDVELVSVFATGDAGLIALAKSLLDAEGIDFFVKGEGLQNFFPLGPTTRWPVEFCVRAEDADRARVLLEGLTSELSRDTGSDG